MTPLSPTETAATLVLALSLGSLALHAGRVVATALRVGGRRDDRRHEDPLTDSRFAMPVSIVVPLTRGNRPGAEAAIACALASAYPEFEVIVVDDGGETGGADMWSRWRLEPREFFYRQVLTTAGAIQRILRSTTDPRLLVVQKAEGGLADALNCGVNLAQYRYVMAVDPATQFAPDAVMRALAPALRDPELLAVATHVERSCTPAPDRRPGVLGCWSHRFQRLRSIRAFMHTRLAATLAPSWGAAGHATSPDLVIAWRRDAVLRAGGFPAGTADPILDLLSTLASAPPSVESDAAGEAGPRSRIATQSDVFGSRTAVGLSHALRETAAGQRRAIEAMRRRWASAGWRAFASGSFLSSPLAAPMAVVVALMTALVAAAAGRLAWADVLLVLAALAVGQALVSTAALLLRGSVPGAPSGLELAGLIAAAPFELVLYRVPLAVLGFGQFRRHPARAAAARRAP